MKTVEQLNFDGKKVFIRLDMNVPIEDGVITDDNRIPFELEQHLRAHFQLAAGTSASR